VYQIENFATSLLLSPYESIPNIYFTYQSESNQPSKERQRRYIQFIFGGLSLGLKVVYSLTLYYIPIIFYIPNIPDLRP